MRKHGHQETANGCFVYFFDSQLNFIFFRLRALRFLSFRLANVHLLFPLFFSSIAAKANLRNQSVEKK